MNKVAALYIKQCKTCQQDQRDNSKEPFDFERSAREKLENCWHRYFSSDKNNYLLIADSHSGYLDFCVQNNLSSNTYINIVYYVQGYKCWFATHGIPETLCSDQVLRWFLKIVMHYTKQRSLTPQVQNTKDPMV